MKVGDVVGARFEITGRPRKTPFAEYGANVLRGVDRETGLDVGVLLEDPDSWLDALALERMVSVARALEEPGLIAPIAVDPIVFERGRCAPLSTVAACVDATLELCRLLHIARSHGLAAAVYFGWVEADGRVRLPAISRRPDLISGQLEGWDSNALHSWLRARLHDNDLCEPTLQTLETWSVVDLAKGLAPHASHPERARDAIAQLVDWPVHSPALDFDEAVRRGEAAHAVRFAEPSPDLRSIRDSHLLALAAVHHHVACTRHASGQRDEAKRHAERAVELDLCPRYLTTLALIVGGDEAGPLLDRAVEAIHPSRPASGSYDADSIVVLPVGATREGVARDASRALHARGVHRARRGDRSGAIEDLEESLRRKETAAARAALEHLCASDAPP